MRKATAVTAVLLLAGCATMGGSGPKASAKLEPTKGNVAAGTVEFVQRGDQVAVTASVTGLTPNAAHGFHVHEKGDCSSGDGMSTGGHFNPGGHPHGPQSAPHHEGDLPALQADAAGVAKTTFTIAGVTVAPGPKSIVGRGLIVHKDPD